MSKTNENYLNLTIGDQIYYLNNVSIEPINVSNNRYIMNDYNENIQNYTNNDNLFWIPSSSSTSSSTITTANNYLEFPYVQITNTTDANVVCVEEGLQFLNILHQGGQFNDRPLTNYIDLNVNNNFNNVHDMKKLTKEKNVSNGEKVDDAIKEDDEDVIFVKKYYIKRDSSLNDKVKLERNAKKRILIQEPRRNPKRQVQLQKASYDLALKLCNNETLNPMRTRRTYQNYHHELTRSSSDFEKSIAYEFKKPEIQNAKKKFNSSTTMSAKKIMKKTRRKELINKDFINNVATSLSLVTHHVKTVVKDNLGSTKDNESQKYLENLKMVLTNTCQLYCAINGGIGEIEISK